jgi:dienelactone hydrolase
VRARDLLDARAYLATQPFVQSSAIALLGRSSGGTTIFAAIVQDANAPTSPPPFALTSPPPFALAVVDYGYCQLAYGDWAGGTPDPSAAIGYRTAVPMLLQVGANDTTVSAPACEALAQSARLAGTSDRACGLSGRGASLRCRRRRDSRSHRSRIHPAHHKLHDGAAPAITVTFNSWADRLGCA